MLNSRNIVNFLCFPHIEALCLEYKLRRPNASRYS